MKKIILLLCLVAGCTREDMSTQYILRNYTPAFKDPETALKFSTREQYGVNSDDDEDLGGIIYAPKTKIKVLSANKAGIQISIIEAYTLDISSLTKPGNVQDKREPSLDGSIGWIKNSALYRKSKPKIR